jgi:iron complex transport system substrate-binding protein
MSLFAACSPEQAVDSGNAEGEATPERIVSLSGSITETIFALGHGEKLVGIDITSTYPKAAVENIAQLGHVSKLNVEAILGLQPDIILAEAADSTKPAMDQLKNSGIPFVFLPSGHTLDKPLEQASILAGTLRGEAAYQEILSSHKNYEAQLESITANREYSPRVLFIYARGKGSMMIAGKDTPAEAMIELAGGKNAITQFSGFQALSPEGLVDIAPDVLLLFDSGLESLGGEQGIWEVAGLSHTPAGKHQRLIAMDGAYLLGFTPRAPEAAVELAKRLNGYNYSTKNI